MGRRRTLGWANRLRRPVRGGGARPQRVEASTLKASQKESERTPHAVGRPTAGLVPLLRIADATGIPHALAARHTFNSIGALLN